MTATKIIKTYLKDNPSVFGETAVEGYLKQSDISLDALIKFISERKPKDPSAPGFIAFLRTLRTIPEHQRQEEHRRLTYRRRTNKRRKMML
jgi:hypothetical protein